MAFDFENCMMTLERANLHQLTVLARCAHIYPGLRVSWYILYFKKGKSLEPPSSIMGKDWHTRPRSKVFVENSVLNDFWFKYFSI